MRKRWIVMLALAGILVLGILGGTALAQSDGDSDPSSSNHSRTADGTEKQCAGRAALGAPMPTTGGI